MEKTDTQKVVLCTDLLLRHILDELHKNEIINMDTYGKAIKEVGKDGQDN